MFWENVSLVEIPPTTATLITPVFVAVIVGLILSYKAFRRSKINLPGPTPWPFFGNLFHVNMKQPHLTFDKWHKTFNGVFKSSFFGTPVVVVGSNESMHEVLVTRGKDFAGRPSSYLFKIWGLSNPWQDGMRMCPPDVTWKMLRIGGQKHIKQFDAGIKRIEDVSNEICQNMLNSFASHNGEPFDPKEYIANAILNHLTLLLLGKNFTQDDTLFRQYISMEADMVKMFSSIGTCTWIDRYPLLRFFGNRTVKLAHSVIRKRHDLYFQMKKEMLGSRKSEKDETLFEYFQKLRSKPTFEGADARTECASINMIFSGTLTTTSILLAFMNIITHYQDVYSKLQTEIDYVIGIRQPRTDDRDNMPYTNAAILELLRFTSISPLCLPHMALKDTAIGDTHIPKGTHVLINIWSSMHDETYWPEPFEFRPERFLDECGKVLPPDHETRKRLWSFGAGPRMCIGETFALGRLFLLVTSMIQRFDIEQPDPKVSCDPRSYELTAVLTPPDFSLKLRSRKFEE